MARYLKKSQPEMSGSLALRGGFSMISRSGGLKPRAVAGRPSVTRLTQSSWTGIRASGKPSAAVRKMLSHEEKVRKMLQGPLILLRTPNSPNHLPHVGGDEVPDELLHVVVNSSAFFHSGHDGGEVVVGEDHLGGGLGYSSAGAHGDADLCLLQGGGVVHAIACLWRTSLASKHIGLPGQSPTLQ